MKKKNEEEEEEEKKKKKKKKKHEEEENKKDEEEGRRRRRGRGRRIRRKRKRIRGGGGERGGEGGGGGWEEGGGGEEEEEEDPNYFIHFKTSHDFFLCRFLNYFKKCNLNIFFTLHKVVNTRNLPEPQSLRFRTGPMAIVMHRSVWMYWMNRQLNLLSLGVST